MSLNAGLPADQTCDQLPVADDAVLDFWIFSRMGFEHALLDAAQSDPHLHLVEMAQLLD